MKIKYTHISNPDEEKIYDTAEALKNNPFVKKSQDEFDRNELQKMKSDYDNGLICKYEVLEKNEITQFIEYLKSQNIVKKYLENNCWLSGSSTTVYPITVWEKSKQIVLQWKSDKNIFRKFIERVKKDNPAFIVDGKFWKSDGSCPSTITFYYN